MIPTILVVEDNPDNMTLLTYELEDRGYEVRGACGGHEALELVQTERPDAILLDVMMPVISGIEVCRRLKADAKLVHVPVIMVTAKNHDRDVIEGLDAGADDYVTKPFNIRILAARLETALRAKKARDTIRQTNARLQAANELLNEKNRQLAQVNELAYEFVDNVSHDFRTPLSVIKEFASIMDDGLAGEVTPQQREYLGIIDHAVEDLTRQVQDMLDVSKLEAGLLTVRRTSCTVQDVVGGVQTALQRSATASKIDLTIAPDQDLPAVYCDAAQIGRVMVNLAINAIKFVGEDGHVRIWARADQEASQVVIGVTDDGPGIDAEKLQVIFERFKQAGINARASTKGVGLGLNIAKELVTLNFGRMSVESEPGKGSTFSFTLPTADPLTLLEHFLHQPSSARNGPRQLSLVTARIEDPFHADVASDVDQLLHDVLRSSDLILRVAPSSWVLLLEVPKEGSRKVIRRIEESRQEANRNRPAGMLPSISLELKGTWATATQRDELFRRFQEEMQTAGQAPTPATPAR